MDQFDHEDTENLVPTPAPAPATETTPTPTPAPVAKKSNKLAIIFSALGAVVFLSLIGFATYSVLTLNEKNDTISSKDKNFAKLQADNKKLVDENRKLTDEAKEAAAADDMSVTATTDDSFTALQPANSIVSTDGKLTYEWTPHKDATKYIVQIKLAQDSNYPTSSPADQVVTINPASPTPKTLSLTKTSVSGDYVWRVTAIHTMNGSDMVLQTTTDRAYRVQ